MCVVLVVQAKTVRIMAGSALLSEIARSGVDSGKAQQLAAVMLQAAWRGRQARTQVWCIAAVESGVQSVLMHYGFLVRQMQILRNEEYARAAAALELSYARYAASKIQAVFRGRRARKAYNAVSFYL